MVMLPFNVSADSKKIHIKDMVVLSALGEAANIKIIVSEPYFQYEHSLYSDGLIFQTPTKMEKYIRSNYDKFSLEFYLNEGELRYLSQFESVPFIYQQGVINSDSDNIFYSTLNVPDLLRKIKASNDEDKKREDNKLENKVMDFFGIDR